MKNIVMTYNVNYQIDFANLSLEEARRLETYLREGLRGKDWGEPVFSITLQSTGGVKQFDMTGRQVTSKELLELEKQHGGGKSCGK